MAVVPGDGDVVNLCFDQLEDGGSPVTFSVTFGINGDAFMYEHEPQDMRRRSTGARSRTSAFLFSVRVDEEPACEGPHVFSTDTVSLEQHAWNKSLTQHHDFEHAC